MVAACPKCCSSRLEPRRVRRLFERWRRDVTGRVRLKCLACGWKGWDRDLTTLPNVLNAAVVAATSVDLAALDVETAAPRDGLSPASASAVDVGAIDLDKAAQAHEWFPLAALKKIRETLRRSGTGGLR